MEDNRLNSNRVNNEENSTSKSSSNFHAYQIAIPVIIGLIAVAWMFSNEFKNFDWNTLPSFSLTMLCGLLFSLLFVAGRDFGMMWRFRAITDKVLSWKQAFKICMLCEFSSAITPSAVGGSAVGMFFLNGEGINMGRATTLMMITILLDELFFVISIPIVVALTPLDELFGSLNANFTDGISVAFWFIYAAIAIWVLILFTGIIWKPQFINKIITRLFSLKILSRWQKKAFRLADNMSATSVEARKKPFFWWVQAFGATSFSWLSRYLVVCALFFAFVPNAGLWIILSRQFVVWAMLMVCPTPGGSGLSEWLFTQYYADVVNSAGLALVIALVWRVVSYYIYLAFGAFIIPSWIKSVKTKNTD